MTCRGVEALLNNCQLIQRGMIKAGTILAVLKCGSWTFSQKSSHEPCPTGIGLVRSAMVEMAVNGRGIGPLNKKEFLSLDTIAAQQHFCGGAAPVRNLG